MMEIRDLHVGYGNVEVLRGIDMSIGESEIVCLLGANGAGKTTLLSAISGLLTVIRGSILFQNQDITRLKPHQVVKLGVGHVPEGRQIFFSLTVMQNLLLGGYSKKRTKAETRKKLDNVFDIFPVLKDRTAQKAGTMSGGEQQMLAIARSLMAEPAMMLFDEPSLGLAPMVVEEIFNVIEKLKSLKMPILLVEQNVAGALSISNRGYIIENGMIKEKGSADDLRRNDEVRKRYLGR